MSLTKDSVDPKLDLILERVLDVPPELVWQAWTDPKHIVHWFCPKPWQTTSAEIDLRPGGIFKTTMKGPEGEEFTNTGCILEAVENRRLVWTDAMVGDFRPAGAPNSCFEKFFTAYVMMEPFEGKTRYTAIAIHADEGDRKKHAEMGFADGWGKASEQLVEYMKQYT